VTHILILQGTPTGAPLPVAIQITRFTNGQHFGGTRVDFRVPNELHPARVVNAQAFRSLVVRNKVVYQLGLTRLSNISSVGAPSAVALPFDPANSETEVLLAALTGTYDTIAKRQIDRLITELKSGGVWGKLDWYGNAHWATSEHDGLLNWVNPAQTLTKVGGASWVIGEGLKGVSPMTDSGRYKSGWNVGDGPHSTPTSFAMFCKVTSVDVPQDVMQPMGLFEYSTPGPSAPNGSWIILSISAGNGNAGANCLPFNGNDGFAVGDGTGVWCTSRSGSLNKTFRNGVEIASSSLTSGPSSYAHADGICAAGSGSGFLAQKSFPGTQLYWGWGPALTAAEAGVLEEAFQESLLPPSSDNVTGSLIVDDDNNYLLGDDDTFIVVDGP
jgi:hypothetical protein